MSVYDILIKRMRKEEILFIRGQINASKGAFAIYGEKTPVIAVAPEIEIRKVVVIVAHELGHYYQFRRLAKGDVFKWSDMVESDLRISLEENAWEHAVRMLHKAGYRDWEFFLTEARDAIMTYYYNLEQFRANSLLLALQGRKFTETLEFQISQLGEKAVSPRRSSILNLVKKVFDHA